MNKKSIYKYASEAGLPAGLYLSAMSACVLMSIKLPSLPILLFPLAIGFPFLLCNLMKSISKAEPSYHKFSSLWLGGIYTVIFGTLICMFLSALYVVFIEPGFVTAYVNNAIATVEASQFAGEYEQTLTLMKEAVAAHILPSGLEFITTIAWFTCFSGCIISLFLALLISKSSRKMANEISM